MGLYWALYNEDGYHEEDFEDTVEVTVSPEYFAKEPPEWLKSWANLWHEFPAADQCQLRRRMLVALTVQPPVVALWLILRQTGQLLFAIALELLLFRNINLRPLIHPWTYRFGDIKGDHMGKRDSRLWADKNGKRRSLFWLLINPPTAALASVGPYLLSRRLHVSYWQAILMVLRTIGAVLMSKYLIGIVAGLVIIYLLIRWMAKNNPWFKREIMQDDDEIHRYRQAMARLKEQEFAEVVSLVACSPLSKQAAISALPRQRRTFHLRYLDLKARLCRPFAA